MNINLTIGVDFTGSNGDPRYKESLHYIGDKSKNQYLNAISEVGKILLNFDTDGDVPLFGFGANISSYYREVSHCFAMNGNFFRPEVKGIEGITECYKNTLEKIKFSGPTYFSPLLKRWNEMVMLESTNFLSKYYVYLILTDGSIHDVDDTIDHIVESSYLPVSVIIIGIGDADFSTMNFLDADDEPLYSNKLQKIQERDNVQFVEFNKFKSNPQLLARETLQELPRQIIQYFTKRKIFPNKPYGGVDYNFVNYETRDYFASKGIEFMQTCTQGLRLSEDLVMNVINKGVPDYEGLDFRELGRGYNNPLSK